LVVGKKKSPVPVIVYPSKQAIVLTVERAETTTGGIRPDKGIVPDILDILGERSRLHSGNGETFSRSGIFQSCLYTQIDIVPWRGTLHLLLCHSEDFQQPGNTPPRLAAMTEVPVLLVDVEVSLPVLAAHAIGTERAVEQMLGKGHVDRIPDPGRDEPYDVKRLSPCHLSLSSLFP
jgi:hypothetical protein